jgi:hypothetical protein
MINLLQKDLIVSSENNAHLSQVDRAIPLNGDLFLGG